VLAHGTGRTSVHGVQHTSTTSQLRYTGKRGSLHHQTSHPTPTHTLHSGHASPAYHTTSQHHTRTQRMAHVESCPCSHTSTSLSRKGIRYREISITDIQIQKICDCGPYLLEKHFHHITPLLIIARVLLVLYWERTRFWL